MKEPLFKLLGLLVLSGSLFAGWLLMDVRQFLIQPLSLPEHGIAYEVESGMGVIRIAADLQRRGIIEHGSYLRWYARWEGVRTGIKAGRYRLYPGMIPRQLLDILRSGAVIQYSITVPEGYNFSQLMNLIAARSELNHSLGTASMAAIMRSLGRDGEHPEGLFFPDTYYFTARSSDMSVLRRALDAMTRHLHEAWERRDADLPYQSPYEALIMASIIEKETSLPAERAQIAGVFVRRLQKNMRLQTDPTVIYGLADRYQGRLHKRDLRTDTPYNTYLHRGLPPTPIAMPGLAAIEAALHPSPGKSLYFVAKGDGIHQFSDTLKAHIQAVRRYQLRKGPS